MVNSILDLKEEEQNVLESEWYQKIKSKSYSGAFSKGITITQNDVKVKLIAYSKRYYMKNRRFTLTVFFRMMIFLATLCGIIAPFSGTVLVSL